MVFNDKPTDGFQRERESKPKTLSWDFYRKLYWLFSEWTDYRQGTGNVIKLSSEIITGSSTIC